MAHPGYVCSVPKKTVWADLYDLEAKTEERYTNQNVSKIRYSGVFPFQHFFKKKRVFKIKNSSHFRFQIG